MGRNAIETVLGAMVLAVAAGFLYIAYNTAQIKTVSGYTVSAAFFKVGGLNKGSDVRVAGIKVGTVLDRYLDPKTYDAVVTLSISGDVILPSDTEAVIASEGMLGGKYIRLEPGKSTEMLADGGLITKTRDFRSLEDQVGEIIFLATSPSEGGDAGGPGAGPSLD